MSRYVEGQEGALLQNEGDKSVSVTALGLMLTDIFTQFLVLPKV